MHTDKTPPHIKIDERDHVEKPLLNQLNGLGWDVFDLAAKQSPKDTGRDNFSEVFMGSVLREQLKIINPWLETDQIEEVVKQLTANFPSNNLLENNRHAFNLLLENTSVSENRQTGRKARRLSSSTLIILKTIALLLSASLRCAFWVLRIILFPI